MSVRSCCKYGTGKHRLFIQKYGAKTVALAGALKDGCEACNAAGIDAYFPIIRKIITLDEAMDGAVAKDNMTKTAEQVFRLIKAFC